ncbi:MAG: hypothetical protein WBP58_14355 [Chitinophagaceae bacterium]
MKLFLSLIILIIVLHSCEKNWAAGRDVEIYLLEDGRLMQDACKLDASSAKLASRPVLRSKDIVSYSSSTYIFTLSEEAFASMEALTDKTLFAVTVDGEVIYFGIVKPFFSSSSCDKSITMNNTRADNTIEMRLGYPGQIAGVVIEDKRNDPRLIATFQSLGKLVP